MAKKYPEPRRVSISAAARHHGVSFPVMKRFIVEHNIPIYYMSLRSQRVDLDDLDRAMRDVSA